MRATEAHVIFRTAECKQRSCRRQRSGRDLLDGSGEFSAASTSSRASE